MEIVFCKTRHAYGSYGDFWRLVEASKFATCFVDELDLRRDCTFIVTPWNGETTPILERARQHPNAKAKVVWWLLERDMCDRGFDETFDQAAALVDDVWVSDRSYATRHPRLRFVMLGGHPDLTHVTNLRKQFDVCTLAYLWGRRQHVTTILAHQGISIAPEAFGRQAQDQIVAASSIMLSMHQYDAARIIAPLRFAVAAAYGLPVLTEQVDDPWPLTSGVDFIEAAYDDLPAATARLLATQSTHQALIENLRLKLFSTTWRFDHCVYRAVADLG